MAASIPAGPPPTITTVLGSQASLITYSASLPAWGFIEHSTGLPSASKVSKQWPQAMQGRIESNSSSLAFLGKSGVSYKGPSHIDHVRLALSHNPLRYHGFLNLGACSYRDVDCILDPFGEIAPGTLRHWRLYYGNRGVVPARHYIDLGDSGLLQYARHFLCIFKVISLRLHQISAAKSTGYGIVLTGFSLDVLDDLDVRASDLLQSNGVVWVEGPSDRIYIKRWIELWTGSELIEGAHYQCVFYGGRLLAHLSADDPQIQTEELVKILQVNRNAILVLDSDRNQEGEELNATKKRLISEFENMDGISWVTAGREVENYIPLEALRKHYSDDSHNPFYRFQLFREHLNNIIPGEGERFSKNKVLYAEMICSHFTKENLAGVLDLKERLNTVCDRIRTWNGLK